MTMTLRPDLCLVKLAPPLEQRTTAAGLILEPALTPMVCYGKVVQVGEKVARYDVAVGDVVAFPPSQGEALDDLFPTPHLLIPVTAIDAVIEKKH